MIHFGIDGEIAACGEPLRICQRVVAFSAQIPEVTCLGCAAAIANTRFIGEREPSRVKEAAPLLEAVPPSEIVEPLESPIENEPRPKHRGRSKRDES